MTRDSTIPPRRQTPGGFGSSWLRKASLSLLHRLISPRASNTPMPTARSIRDASYPHSFWKTALRSVRFRQSGAISKRSFRRSLCSGRRRKTRRWLPCGNGAPNSRALRPSWKEFATPRNASKTCAIAGPHDYDQIPALAERSRLRVKNFYADIDTRLAEAPYVAGNTFSAADITALVTVDFATKAMSFSVPGDHAALERWYENVSSRPSVGA